MKKLTIGVENSKWNNIGDAFYASSVESIFSKLFPDSTVVPIESNILKSFRPPSFFENDVINIAEYQDVDLVVLSGPILAKEIPYSTYYIDLLSKLKNNNIPYCIVSAFGTHNGLKDSIQVLNEYPPLFISTRDLITYTTLTQGNPSFPVYNSICFAYYSSLMIKSSTINYRNKFIASSIYKKIPFDYQNWNASKLLSDELYVKELYSSYCNLPKATHLNRLVQAMKRHNDLTDDSFNVIHTMHDVSLMNPAENYASKPLFFSRRPEGYLSIYKSASLVITDRVHACISSITHGTPSIYLSSSNRDGAITNLGAGNLVKGLYHCDSAIVEREYKRISSIICDHVNSI